jgi:hypothetical protein
MMRHHRNKHETTHPYAPPPPHTPPPPPQRKEEHFVFKHPFTMTVSGVTSCGKTYFVHQLNPQFVVQIYS